jgi:hypothetical protein
MTPKASEFAKLMSMREPMVLYDDEDAKDVKFDSYLIF